MHRLIRKLTCSLHRDDSAGLWVTWAPSLGCLSSYGDSPEAAAEHLREAAAAYLGLAERHYANRPWEGASGFDSGLLPERPWLSGREVAAALREAGFEDLTLHAGHLFMRDAGWRRLVAIPTFGGTAPLPAANLHTILTHARVTAADLQYLAGEAGALPQRGG